SFTIPWTKTHFSFSFFSFFLFYAISVCFWDDLIPIFFSCTFCFFFRCSGIHILFVKVEACHLEGIEKVVTSCGRRFIPSLGSSKNFINVHMRFLISILSF